MLLNNLWFVYYKDNALKYGFNLFGFKRLVLRKK